MRYVNNPPNPYLTDTVEWIGEPPEAKLEIFEETETRSVINKNNSPDIPFDYSVNCYRGCPHACTYCFSRPKHEFLGWGAGTDFERKIVAKVNAPKILRAEFMKKSWKGETLNFFVHFRPVHPAGSDLSAHAPMPRSLFGISQSGWNHYEIRVDSPR